MKNKKTLLELLSFGIVCFLLGATFVYAQVSQTAVISGGSYPGAPDYTVWENGAGTFYAKNAYGVLSYTGTNASDLINDVLDADTYGTVFIKNGNYTLDVPLTPSPYNNLIGESFGGRQHMVTLLPSAIFPPSDYLIKIQDPNNAYSCGSIQNLYLYNNITGTVTVNGILLDAQNTGGSNDNLKNYLVRDVRFTYMDISLHLMGFCWESTFENLEILGFNTAWSGTYGIWLDRGTGGGTYNEGPGLNHFNGIYIRDDGGFHIGFYFGNESKYNKVNMIEIYKGNYSVALMAFENAFSNLVSMLRTSDVGGTGDGVLFNGSSCLANSITQSQLNPVGGIAQNMLHYINWPFNNYVQCDAHGALIFGAYKINGTQAGYNTVVDLLPPHTDLAHSNSTNPISYSGVSGNVTIRYWNGTIYAP